MFTSNDYEVMKARNADIQRQAEMDHLADKATQAADAVPAHKVVMAKVGKALVAIGSQLESQASVNIHGEATSVLNT